MKTVWPNFFIVGAPRSGTTSLYNYLKSTSKIYMSPVKEPGYFIPNDFRQFTRETYLALFKAVKDEKAIGEASAGYLINPETPKLIHETVPNAKIIISLRDPVYRTFSDYQNMIRVGNTNTSFDEALKKYSESGEGNLGEIIKPSFYSESVKRYLEIFKRENVKVLIFEKTIQNQIDVIKDVLKFLDVDADPPSNIMEVYNSYSEPLGKVGTSIVKNNTINKIAKKILPKDRRENTLRFLLNKKGKKPHLSSEQKLNLTKIFKKDVDKLERLLGFDLPWSKI